METLFWGPDGWLFLHTLTYLYPDKPSFNDKYRTVEFFKNVAFILPCKYCRASFLRYSNSLPINKFLDNKELLTDWLYRIHNKVNGKLKRQHLNSSPNPSKDNVDKKYNTILKNILNITKNNITEESILDVVHYIGNLGFNFLGSIIFNYQSYYSNCHTTDEKTRIIQVYHNFFNNIIPLIFGYFGKEYKRRQWGIRTYLLLNESYSRLLKWFYNQKDIIDIESKFSCYDDYLNYFNKHSVASCNMPISNKIKSCRKNNNIKKTKKIIN